MTRCFRILPFLMIVLAIGCGYRFVAVTAGEKFSLTSLRNATSETGLASLVEEALLKTAGIGRGNDGLPLEIVLTDFSEVVESTSSTGEPVRQRLYLVFEWKAGGQSGHEKAIHRLRVERSYLWSPDPASLDWSRGAALQLLAEEAATAVSDGLERLQ